MARIQKPFLLLALFSLLTPSYCYSDLLWPSLWPWIFFWASAWNFDLAVWPLRRPASPVHSCFPDVGILSIQSTELLSQPSLPSHLPSAQPHLHLGPTSWPGHSHPSWVKGMGYLTPISVPGTETPTSVLTHSGPDPCHFSLWLLPVFALSWGKFAEHSAKVPILHPVQVAELSECPDIFRTILIALYFVPSRNEVVTKVNSPDTWNLGGGGGG